jgi:uncharacterized protein YbjT (DUF2867 family)
MIPAWLKESSMKEWILVLGATGNVGTPLVAQLAAEGRAVRTASRRGTAVPGAEGVRFDLADPATFDAALEGVSRVFVLAPGGTVDAKAVLTPFVERAIEKRVAIVLHSVLGVDADDSIPYRQVELMIERSGVPFVILRPNWFADNFHTSWLPGIRQGTIAVPAAAGKSSFIDVRDIAASAAVALTSDRFDGRAFNLTGPAAYGYAEAAGILSRVAGRPVSYTPIDDETFVSGLTGVGVPADYALFLAAIFHPVREGWTSVVTGEVTTLTGRVPRSLEQYAADHAAAFRGE